jgi:hypothetical protein
MSCFLVLCPELYFLFLFRVFARLEHVCSRFSSGVSLELHEKVFNIQRNEVCEEMKLVQWICLCLMLCVCLCV